jgi:Tat protein translocase TatB subunit
MFEVGFTEIILIFGIALLVLGPARLPKLAADLGRWAGRARAMARQLRTQLEQEVHFDPLATSTTGSTTKTAAAAVAAAAAAVSAAAAKTPANAEKTATDEMAPAPHDSPEAMAAAPLAADDSARAMPLQAATEGAPAPDAPTPPRQDGQ